MYMYICEYAYVYVYIYIYMYTYMYTYMHSIRKWFEEFHERVISKAPDSGLLILQASI